MNKNHQKANNDSYEYDGFAYFLLDIFKEAENTRDNLIKAFKKNKLPEEERHRFVYEAMKEMTQEGDSSHGGYWAHVDRKNARERYSFITKKQKKNTMTYFVGSRQYEIASDMAAMLTLPKQAQEYAEKCAENQEDVEEKAEWFIKAGSYAIRTTNLNKANKLYDKVVDAFVQLGDLKKAAEWAYTSRIERIEHVIHSRIYWDLPPFVDERYEDLLWYESIKKKPLVPIKNIDKAIEFYQTLGGHKRAINFLLKEKKKINSK